MLVLPCRADVAKELAAIEARLKVCVDKDSSNLGMKMCTGDADADADKVLQATYKGIVTQLKAAPADEADDAKEKLKRLVAAERAWIAFRDTDCDLRGIEMLGGSGESLVVEGCAYSMTRDRAKALDELFGNH